MIYCTEEHGKEHCSGTTTWDSQLQALDFAVSLLQFLSGLGVGASFLHHCLSREISHAIK